MEINRRILQSGLDFHVKADKTENIGIIYENAHKMKRVIIVVYLVFIAFWSGAQSYNPFVSQGVISPAPLLPWEFNGTGTASFNVGNTGSTPLPLLSNQE